MATRKIKSTTRTSAYRQARHDRETTPTRRQPEASGAPYTGTRLQRTPPRRNSFEETQVTALPDPRTPQHVSFYETWKNAFLEDERSTLCAFLSELETLLARANRLPEYNYFFSMLQESAQHGSVDLSYILDVACRLFGRNKELVHLFNDVLPPGYRMETHPSYIAVFTPEGGWTADHDGVPVHYTAV